MATKKHTRLVFALLVAAVLMFVFGFALVPLYNSLCLALGINGKLPSMVAAHPVSQRDIQKDRTITVEFIATINGVPWKFYPRVRKVLVHPGEMTKLSFYAENMTTHAMTVQAIPSVTPGLAAKYIKKTECFCFEKQTLGTHEAVNMPLIFHLDKDLPLEIKTITLAYALFDVTGRE